MSRGWNASYSTHTSLESWQCRSFGVVSSTHQHTYLRPLRCQQLDTSVLSCDTVGGGAYLAMCTFPFLLLRKTVPKLLHGRSQPAVWHRGKYAHLCMEMFGSVRMYVCTRRRRFYSARSKKFSFFFCVSQTKHFAFVTEKLRFLWLPFVF